MSKPRSKSFELGLAIRHLGYSKIMWMQLVTACIATNDWQVNL